MPIWIRAKSTAWSCHGNVGRLLISYHMKSSGRIWTSTALPSSEAKDTDPVTPSQTHWPLHSSKNSHVLEQKCPLGGMRRGWTSKEEGWQGQKAGKLIKDGDNFPFYFPLPRKSVCSCVKEICCFLSRWDLCQWPQRNQDWPQVPGELNEWS